MWYSATAPPDPEVKSAGDPESASDVHYIIYGTNEPHRTREFLRVPLCGLRIRSRKGLIHRGFTPNFSRFSIQPVFWTVWQGSTLPNRDWWLCVSRANSVWLQLPAEQWWWEMWERVRKGMVCSFFSNSPSLSPHILKEVGIWEGVCLTERCTLRMWRNGQGFVG